MVLFEIFLEFAKLLKNFLNECGCSFLKSHFSNISSASQLALYMLFSFVDPYLGTEKL